MRRASVIGEHRFVGLFTTAYSADQRDAALLRRKVDASRSAPASRPTATWPRPCSTRWRPSRATTCSRFPRTSCVDGYGHPGPGRAAPAAAVPVEGPVRPLRLLPAVRAARELLHAAAPEVPALLLRAQDGTHIDFDVLLSGTWLARIHFGARAPNPCPRWTARTWSAGWRRWRAAGRTSCATRWSRPKARPPGWRWSGAGHVAGRLPQRVPPRAAVHDIRKLDGAHAEVPLGLALYWPLGAPEGRLGLKVYRWAHRWCCPTACPMLEPHGAAVLGKDNHRIDAPRASPYSCTTSRWRRGPARRSIRRRWRACSRTRSRACSAARSTTTASTGWCCSPDWRPKRSWCCAPALPAADRLRAVAGHHRRDAGGASAHRPHAGVAVPAALRSRRPRTPNRPRPRSTRWTRRWTR